LQTQPEDHKAELTTAAPLRFGFDFGHIPIHSPAAGVIETKLMIKNPRDGCEQEADQVSERVVRMPEAQLPRGQASDGTWAEGRKGQSAQKPERVQLSGAGGDGLGQTVAPPIVHEVLRGPGQPLDAAMRAFMEPRFGYDFSRVRVHSGPVAEQSARDVNAEAYTVGHNVVFGDGRFLPATHEGRRLLAHELTHVVQQSAGAPSLQRAPKKDASPPAPRMTEADAEAWYREMNVDEAFADPSQPWAEGDPVLSGPALEESIEESLHQTLTPEEMHRQLLVRRAQPLTAGARLVADPQAALDNMQLKITGLQAEIAARKAEIAKLKKLGPSSTKGIDRLRNQISGFEDEVSALTKARGRLPKSSMFSRMGRGAPAGTGRITYAGIQIETAAGERVALEFAETVGTEHAEEIMIRWIGSKLTKAQLSGSRVTVVGDQFVCGERCVPALTRFAELNDIESVDSIVFQRIQVNPPPPDFVGPQELASPRTTLRTMTESKSAGIELIKREIPIYRRPVAQPPTGLSGVAAESAMEEAVITAASATSVPEVTLDLEVAGEAGLLRLAVAEIAVNVLLPAVSYYLDKWYAEKAERKFKNDLKDLLPEINDLRKEREEEILEKSKIFPLVYANVTILYSHDEHDPTDYHEGSMRIFKLEISHQNYQTPEILSKHITLWEPIYSLTFSVPLFEEKAAEKGASSSVRNYRQVREHLTDPSPKSRLAYMLALQNLVRKDSSLRTLVIRDMLGMLKDQESGPRVEAAIVLSELRAKIAIPRIYEVLDITSNDEHRELIQRYLRVLEQE
jgi:hypothetical protein